MTNVNRYFVRIYTYILSAKVVTHWNVRAEPELGLECAAEGGRLAKGQPTGVARTRLAGWTAADGGRPPKAVARTAEGGE